VLLSIPYADATPRMLADDWPALKPSLDWTHQGCSCKGKCGVTLTHDSARCDWCRTNDNCGNRDFLLGSWDYCKYDPQDDFEDQSYAQKTEQLWASITDPSVVGKSGPVHLAATTLKMLVTTSMITPFEDQREVMPTGREKVIHTQGVMCRFDLAVRSDSPFTGVLSPGTQSGLIRLGSATSLDEPLARAIFPGFGIKFLRSGVRSADWVGLRATGPKGSYDFFDSVFSNHVAPDPALSALMRFQQASGCIDMVGLSDACSYTQNGEKVSAPVFPFEVMFEPTGAASFEDKRKSNDDLMKELSGISPGTELFNLYAFASPTDKLQGNRISLGTLKTTDTCHQSLFGDLDLMFRHQRMEEDFALAPEWIPVVESFGDSACTATAGPISQWSCPHLSSQAVDV